MFALHAATSKTTSLIEAAAPLYTRLCSEGKAGVSEMSEWQPIETAPKDGTEIDIWMSGFRYPNSYWGRVEQAWLDVDGGKLYDIFFEEPTHWMPEPDPPPGLEHGGLRRQK